jgi:glutamate-ammonia-ligase adenylyltransferase
VTDRLVKLIEQSPDPQATSLRLDRLGDDPVARNIIDGLAPDVLAGLVQIVGTSKFLYHALCRHPDSIALIGQRFDPAASIHYEINNADALRRYKYSELLKITWMDLADVCCYEEILTALSCLADNVIRITGRIVDSGEYMSTDNKPLDGQLALFGMGKLGAVELNYSSDVDLIFVCANVAGQAGLELQENAINHIRRFGRLLEEQTEEGFLYRVDLKLRPWGKSGPLVLSIDDTEQYYEASTEAWERFAWLRARLIDGSDDIGADMLQRLKPFVFHRALSTDDLQRFLQIKTKMADVRMRDGSWNVKLGEGGIRDIEFYIQMLQLINGAHYPELQNTNTLTVLNSLVQCGIMEDDEKQMIRDAYLFLRKLENRLQIIDERQTHDLPDEIDKRQFLARSLGFEGTSDEECLARFETTLNTYRQTATQCYERILLEKPQLI